MKVLFILTYYYPHWTGLSVYAKRLAEGLRGKGDEVRVLTTKYQDNLKSFEEINGVDVIRKDVLFRLSRSTVSLSMILGFWKEIKESDKVIVFLPYAEVPLVSIIAKILNKQVYLVHNGDLVLPKGIINRVLEDIYFWSTSIAIHLSKAIILHTRDYATHSVLLSKYRDKWLVILPPFKIPDEDEKSTKDIKKRLKQSRHLTVGFSGRFVEEKGFDLLLCAIPFVIAKMPTVQFIYAGETKVIYENFFENNVGLINKYRNNLTLLGKLTEKEMASFYKLLDVFVVSSRTDCFPFVGVEAMLAGVPLVVTNIPGARTQVKETGMGVIVKSNDPESLAEGIIEVLTYKSKYIRNKANVEKLYDYEKSIRRYQEILG